MDDLNKRIINLEIKTKILESDKTWGKSILKRIIELAFIYITFFLFLLIIKRANKLIACLIPMLSYIIYLFLLNLVKKIWIKKFKSGDK